MYNVIYISQVHGEVRNILYVGAQKGKMKTININELQAQISRVIRNVEAGETYEVMRYSKPVAVIVPKKEHKTGKTSCDICQDKLDAILNKLEKTVDAK